jgi:hypothetical protein
MRADILQSKNSNQVRDYVNKKFKIFDGWTYSKGTREKKCISYYLCASEENRRIVADAYFLIFKGVFPTAQADETERELERKAAGPIKVEWSQGVKKLEGKQEDAQQLLDQLVMWRDTGKWQEGPEFYNILEGRVRKFNPNLVRPAEFQTEVEAKRVAQLTGKTTKSAREVQAEFEGMIGVKQSAGISFEAYSPNWGQINAALKEDFKAGVWASGSARAAMTKRGFDLQTQATVGFGAELNIDGSCTWKKGNKGLDLSGNCNLFAGAEARGEARISVDLYEGINASLDLDAFAGVRASVRGRCAFTHDDKTMVGVEAEASVQFGIGGSLSGSINCPIFGATQIGFSSSVTVGLGMGVSAKTEIHFTEIYLAGKEDFRKILYLPTMAKGYRMDLMTDDAKNLHYLDKCIARISEGVSERRNSIETLESVPDELKPFLLSTDDYD